MASKDGENAGWCVLRSRRMVLDNYCVLPRRPGFMDTVEKLVSRLALGLMFAGILLAVTLPGKGSGMPKGSEASSNLNAADRQFLTGAAEDRSEERRVGKGGR